MNAILSPGNKTFELARKMQFVALTADGSEQEPPAVDPPSPELHRIVRSGEAAGGWIVLLAEEANKKPVMFFDPAAGGAMGGGRVLSSGFTDIGMAQPRFCYLRVAEYFLELGADSEPLIGVLLDQSNGSQLSISARNLLLFP
jgi:hypothetical protein